MVNPAAYPPPLHWRYDERISRHYLVAARPHVELAFLDGAGKASSALLVLQKDQSACPMNLLRQSQNAYSRAKTVNEALMSRPFTFAVYFAAIFLQAGAYGLTFMLPRLFGSFGASEKIVGAMLFVTAISTIISVYFAGHLSDAVGRLRTLGVACFAIAASLYLYGVVDVVSGGLVAASVLLGFGWGLTYSLGPIVLTRLVRPDERVRYFALLSVFVMAGFGLSPVLASALDGAGYSLRDAFLVNAALCAISAVLFLLLHGQVKTYALDKGPEASSRLTLATVSSVLKSRALIPVMMVCLGVSVFAGMNNFQTVFADARGLDYANFFLT
jgi:MFS family permease